MTYHQLHHNGAFQRPCMFTLKDGNKIFGILFEEEKKIFFVERQDINTYKLALKNQNKTLLAQLHKEVVPEDFIICEILYS